MSSQCAQCASEGKARSYVTPDKRSYELWSGAKKRAAQKKLPFTITREWVRERLALGICEATQLQFDMSAGRGEASPFAPSLDQKVSSLGYTPANTQVVVLVHNVAKGSWGDAPIHVYAKALAINHGLIKR